jgi:hypothetical protein
MTIKIELSFRQPDKHFMVVLNYGREDFLPVRFQLSLLPRHGASRLKYPVSSSNSFGKFLNDYRKSDVDGFDGRITSKLEAPMWTK